MIRNSYIFLPGISTKLEENIWKQGIRSWDDFIEAKEVRGISSKRKLFYNNKLREAKKHLFEMDSSYFAGKLGAESWRLYDFFKDQAVFLDIETSGVESDSYITIVGLFDGINTKVMVRDIDFNALKKELEQYKMIVTFNGGSFDIPFLKKKYPKLFPHIPHVDVKTMCSKIGLTGGLKEIEKTLGIKRNKIIERMYGGDPLKLWRMFLGSGDDYYLKLLVEYNEEDCINLKQIANHAYEENRKFKYD